MVKALNSDLEEKVKTIVSLFPRQQNCRSFEFQDAVPLLLRPSTLFVALIFYFLVTKKYNEYRVRSKATETSHSEYFFV